MGIKDIKSTTILQLNEARQHCLEANDNLTKSYNLIADKEKLELKLIFTINSLRNHLLIFDTIQKSVTETIRQDVLQYDYEKAQTDVAIKQLQNVYSQMEQIAVDSTFGEVQQPRDTTLIQYIDKDSTDKLIQDTKELYTSIDELIEGKERNNLQLRLKNEAEFLANQWEDVQSFDQRYLSNKNTYVQVEELMSKNEILETEVVNCLKRMNQQLDDCLSYGTHSGDSTDAVQLAKIEKYHKSSNDLLTIRGNCDMIEQNCKDIAKITRIYSEFKDKLNACFQEIADFTINVIEKQVQRSLLDSVRRIHEYFDTLEDKRCEIEHYVEASLKFINSFSCLVVEIDRRRNLNDKIKSMIDSFQEKLLELQDEDRVIREEFLDNHSEFLPQNLIQPQFISSKFPNIILQYKLEDFPLVSDKMLKESIERIKQHESKQ